MVVKWLTQYVSWQKLLVSQPSPEVKAEDASIRKDTSIDQDTSRGNVKRLRNPGRFVQRYPAVDS
eukprot:721962-Amphidinium_carterae.1